MSYAKILSRASFGVDAPEVTVEVHLSNGLPALLIVGLASAEVKESRERVRSAILNSGFEFPARRITINLAPADLPKVGGRFDLAIAIGILAASGQIPMESVTETEWLAEMGLYGALKPVPGVLNAINASQKAHRKIVIATANLHEASLAGYSRTIVAEKLKDLVSSAFSGQWSYSSQAPPESESISVPCLSQVRGNHQAKRALLIAAVGGHNLLMVGTPGCGKTMMANALRGLYPPLAQDEARQVAALESLSNQGFTMKGWDQIRFRAPHHSCSQVAITGGGKVPTPGEITLAHQGILFLDELPEFSRQVLESLRQPLEEGCLSISRADWKVTFPANFQLVAAMNPCPCGYFNSPRQACRCPSTRVQNYLNKLSGPLLDRIDLQVTVWAPDSHLLETISDEDWKTADLKPKVAELRAHQLSRQGRLNTTLDTEEILSYKATTSRAEAVFKQAVEKYNLSMRVQKKLLRLAMTISDIEGRSNLNRATLLEALSYRAFDQLQAKLHQWVTQ